MSRMETFMQTSGSMLTKRSVPRVSSVMLSTTKHTIKLSRNPSFSGASLACSRFINGCIRNQNLEENLSNAWSSECGDFQHFMFSKRENLLPGKMKPNLSLRSNCIIVKNNIRTLRLYSTLFYDGFNTFKGVVPWWLQVNLKAFYRGLWMKKWHLFLAIAI